MGVSFIFLLTWLSGGVWTRAEFWGRWWWSWGQMLRAAAQPLLLFAQRNHFVAKLLVWRPAYKPTVHVFGFDVGLDLMSVKDKKYMLLFVNNIRNSSLPSVYHCWISLSTQTKQFHSKAGTPTECLIDHNVVKVKCSIHSDKNTSILMNYYTEQKKNTKYQRINKVRDSLREKISMYLCTCFLAELKKNFGSQNTNTLSTSCVPWISWLGFSGS